MMISEGTGMSIQVPSIMTSSPSGGRFDFDDGGTYCGGWQDGKAHGHGVCTGPKNVGEYSGSWNFGYEMSGVYKWKNGAVYEGRWQNGKRHGVGVEYNGKWIYKGEWSQGFKGRYGVKASSNSAVKYEGTWANGLQDGYGSETYSDGGFYQGQMFKGLRHGYGVRKSAPYGDSQLTNPNKNGLNSFIPIHSETSLQSGSNSEDQDDPNSPKPEDGFKPNIDRTLASKNGFVLVAKPLDVPMPSTSYNKYNGDKLLSLSSSSSSSNHNARRNSLTNKLTSARIPGSNQTATSLLRNLRLRKQKSTSDLDAAGIGGGGRSSGNRQNNNNLRNNNNNANHTDPLNQHNNNNSSGGLDLPIVPFALQPEELDISDPTTVETYTGEWKQDKRNGHGVCDRSDGLKYEGQWHNDMKCGYGVTTFKNGIKEEGKYKNNILIVDSKVKRLFHFGSANIRQRIDDAVKMAHQAQTMALKKAEIADTRAATGRDKADQATTAALEADRDSQIAFSVARQYSDSQQQLGMGLQQQSQVSNASLMGPGGFQQQQQQVNPLTGEPLLPNFAISSSLQLRRISQQQQQQQRFGFNQYNSNQLNDSSLMSTSSSPTSALSRQRSTDLDQQNQQLTADQQHQHQQQQYLSAVEPFNGRRGSFRGTNLQQTGSASSGYQSAFTGNARNTHLTVGAGIAQVNRQPNDPFNDLFDHYKSVGSHSNAANHLPGHLNSTRRPYRRQTSLDQSQLRASAPRQLVDTHQRDNAHDKRLFRMSSMDHAEEHQQQQQVISGSRMNSQEQVISGIQQQLKHLVTSGEELQQQQQQQQISGQSINANNNQRLDSSTNEMAQSAGSSYILPHSNGSSYFGGTQTPSPDRQSSFRSPSSQYYAQQQQQQQQQSQNQQQTLVGYHQRVFQPQFQNQQTTRQRDAQSLADEQLYLAGRRMHNVHNVLDKTDFTNYDFTISSSPPLSRRLMRRTASLSRHTPIHSAELQGGPSPAGSIVSTAAAAAASGSRRALRDCSPSPILSATVGNFQTAITVTAPPTNSIQVDSQQHQQQQQQANQLITTANSSHLHLTSPDNSSGTSSSGGGLLTRKPSLQVRYNPVELGGLMSREEVAALSHAQREQKRLEFELAEKRAKRPILHLYLSLKEFITRQRLLLSVFIINVCFFKMFADLIVQ